MFQLAQGDLLLLLVPRDRVGLFRQVRIELFVGPQQLEPLFVEGGRPAPVQLAELVALRIVGEDREPRQRGAKRQLLPLEVHARCENLVLELVVLLRELSGDEPALARLAEPVEPFAPVFVGTCLLVFECSQLVAAEEVGVPRDDRRLLRYFLLADADGSPLLRALVEIPLELFLELRGTAPGIGRHLEYSIQPRRRPAPRACRRYRSAGRA